MIQELERELVEVRDRMNRANKLRERIRAAEANRAKERKRSSRFHRILKTEEGDVKQLEGLTFKSFFAKLSGNKSSRLKKEKDELLAAKLKLEESLEFRSAVDLELQGLKKELDRLGDVDREYESLIHARNRLVRRKGGQKAARLIGWAEREVDLQSQLRELDEAIGAGQKASSKLARVVRSLREAHQWGQADLWSDRGMFGDVGKFQKVDEAKRSLARARRALSKFSDELRDVGIQAKFRVKIEEFSRTIDLYFDHFLTDMFAQSKLKGSMNRIRDVRQKVRYLVIDLKKRRDPLRKELRALKDKRRDMAQ